MKSLALYTVDAFAEQPFTGNPAAVCLDNIRNGLDESHMQLIATEMNISETAFVRCLTEGDSFSTSERFKLRWFTPTCEVQLCGHATLATAAVIFRKMGNKNKSLTFETLSGNLIACCQRELISLDLPAAPSAPKDMEEFTELLQLVTDVDNILEVHFSQTARKLLVRLKDTVTRSQLEAMSPDIESFTKVHHGEVRGVILTVRGCSASCSTDSHGNVHDFLSRYFSPWNGIAEDPVTGAAHTVLAPYWSEVMGKQQLYARQCSHRGGDVVVTMRNDGRVDVAGHAVVVLEGTINVMA